MPYAQPFKLLACATLLSGWVSAPVYADANPAATPAAKPAAKPASIDAKAAARFVKTKQSRIKRLVDKAAKGNDSAKAALDKALGELLAFDTIAERSLGKHWSALAADKQSAFSGLLTSLVETNYRNSITSTRGYAVKYRGTKAVKNPSEVLVLTTAKSKKDKRAPALSLDYRVQTAGNNFEVTDVITDGVSMVDNYQNQFGRIIEKDGFDALMDKMRKKLAALEKQAAK